MFIVNQESSAAGNDSTKTATILIQGSAHMISKCKEELVRLDTQEYLNIVILTLRDGKCMVGIKKDILYKDFNQLTTWECDHRHAFSAISMLLRRFVSTTSFPTMITEFTLIRERQDVKKCYIHISFVHVLGYSSTLPNHTQHHPPSSCLPHSQHSSLATLYPLPDKMEQLDRLNLFAVIVSQVSDTHRDSTYPGN